MNSVLSKLVASEGGCLRCALRLAGEVQISSYELPEDAGLSNSCTICLGILSPAGLLDSVRSQVFSSGYEFSDYKFQVSLPPVVYLRQEWIYGKCKLSGIPLEKVVEIKDVFKWVFSPVLARAIDKKFSVDSDFKINIKFVSDESSEEVNEFYRVFKANPKESVQSVFKIKNPERFAVAMPEIKPYKAEAEISCSYAPVYVHGNYLKLSRKISQTPWNKEGENEVVDSVQDSIGRKMIEHFKANSAILHSSV